MTDHEQVVNIDGPAGLEFLDPQVVEAALSVLARKTRAELILGLLEEFTAGRLSGRAVLADYRCALAGLSPAGGVGAAEWERLRQVGRAKGEPIVEWEIFHGLDLLARRAAAEPSGQASSGRRTGGSSPASAQRPRRRPSSRRSPGLSTLRPPGGSQFRTSAAARAPVPGQGPSESGISIDALESAMDLAGPGGLGERWSLHAYLAETREKLGPHLHPRDPELLGATLLNIDHARQLLKPGGLSIDVGLVEPQQADLHTVDSATARNMFTRYRDILGPQLAAAAGIQMLRAGVPGPDGVASPNHDVDRALTAGKKIVAAQQARAKADDARQRASAVRDRRVSASGNAIYLGGVAATALATGIGVSAGLRADLASLIGMGAGAVTLLGRGLQDWEQTKEPLIAPFRAWWTARRADRAERDAATAVQALFRASTPISVGSAASHSRRPGVGRS